MLKRILELLDYIKADVPLKGLDYVFPEVQNVFYLNTSGDTDFVYTRLDKDTFHVAKSLYQRNEPDFESELSNRDMLDTIKQSQDDHDIRISKTNKGYDITLIDPESNGGNNQRDPETLEKIRINRAITKLNEVKDRIYKVIIKDKYDKDNDLMYIRVLPDAYKVWHKLSDNNNERISKEELIEALSDYLRHGKFSLEVEESPENSTMVEITVREVTGNIYEF